MATPSIEPDPKARPGEWTRHDEEVLLELVSRYGESQWEKIAGKMRVGFTGAACRARWPQLRTSVIKGPWTREEDILLRKMVAQYGTKRWSLIASRIRGRIGKQCRERWLNHLDPDVKKSAWDAAEDRKLIEAQERIGNRWSQIAKLLPGRSENAVKNRWNSIMNRKWAHDIQQAGHIATAAGTSPVSASAGADGGEPGLVPTPPSAHRRRRAAAGTGPRCHVPGAPGAAAPGTGSSPCVEAVRGTAPDVVTEESQVFFRGLPGRRNRRLRRPEPAHRAATSSGQPSSPHPTSPADAGGSRQSPRDTAATLGQGVVPRQSQRFRYRAPASSVQEAVSSAYQSLASGSAVPPLPTPESGADTGFLANRQVAWRQRGARAGAVAARMSAEEAEEAVGVPQRRRPDAGTLPNTAAEGSDGLRVAQQFLVSEMARQRLFDRVSLQEDAARAGGAPPSHRAILTGSQDWPAAEGDVPLEFEVGVLTTGHPIKRGRGSSGPRDLDESAGTWGEDSLEDSAQSLRQQLKRRGAASAGREAGTEPATSASQAAPGLTPLPGVGVPPSADIHSAIGAVAEAARSGLEEEEEGPKGPTLPGHSFAWTLAGQEEGAAAAVVHPWAPAVEPTQGLHSSESSGPVAVTSTVESYFSSSEEPGMSLESSVSGLLSSSDHAQRRAPDPVSSSGRGSVPEPPKAAQAGEGDLSESLQSLSLEATSESVDHRSSTAGAPSLAQRNGFTLQGGHSRGRPAPRLRVPTTPRGQALDRLSPTARELLRASQAYKAGHTTLEQYRWRKDAILRNATPHSRLRATVESAPFLVPTPSNGPRPPGARSAGRES